MNVSDFVREARDGVVTVEFRKIDTGDLRVMPCTLQPEKIPTKMEVRDQDPKSDHIVVWSIDKDAWRSFRVSTVEKWYKGMPVERQESTEGV